MPWTSVLCLLAAARAALPEGPVIVGYQNWGACDVNETLAAAASGVNVVAWFAINLERDAASGAPLVSGGPDPACFADVAAALDARGLATTHVITIGGWDAPHPDPSFDGFEWFDAWQTWNAALPRPFDGFDWDLEGNDDAASPYNALSDATLAIAVNMSEAARARGLVVTMVPAQSYFDETSRAFDRSLLHAYPDWHPEFAYHGMNG